MDCGLKLQKQSLWLAKLGTVLYTGPIWGFLGSVMGMTRAFDELKTGNADGAALAQDIKFAVITTLISMVVGAVGAILMLTALYRGKSLPYWIFWVTIFLSLLWCLYYFPFGAIIGAPTGALFLMRWKEFGK